MRNRRPQRARAGHADASTGRVRIIGGRWRGTRLPVPARPGLRPTPDRVRETLFNWLDPVLTGARVLDLFAGSGALGLEAVSRGAREAFLVERDPVACEALRGVVERLGAGREVRLLQADAVELLRAPVHGRFDVVFLDPPFEADAWTTVVERLPPWLAPDAWLYLETPPDRVPATPGWRLHREGASRGTRHALLRRVVAEGGTESGTESGTDTLREVPDSTPSTTR